MKDLDLETIFNISREDTSVENDAWIWCSKSPRGELSMLAMLDSRTQAIQPLICFRYETAIHFRKYVRDIADNLLPPGFEVQLHRFRREEYVEGYHCRGKGKVRQL